MTSRTMTRPAKNAFAPKVIEIKADFAKSKAIDTLLSLEELPRFLSRGGIKALEGTESYKQNGYVSFYLDTVGTTMNGTYKFNT